MPLPAALRTVIRRTGLAASPWGPIGQVSERRPRGARDHSRWTDRPARWGESSRGGPGNAGTSSRYRNGTVRGALADRVPADDSGRGAGDVSETPASGPPSSCGLGVASPTAARPTSSPPTRTRPYGGRRRRTGKTETWRPGGGLVANGYVTTRV